MKLESPIPGRPDASLAGMAAMFRRGAALVDAALEALTEIEARIARPDVRGGGKLHATIAGLAPIIEGAGVGVDNLLVATRSRIRPLTLFTLARQDSGTVSVQSIEIDRSAVAVSDGGTPASPFAYDQLRAAARADVPPEKVTAMLEALRSRVHFAISRLSISKARIDLQARFLDSVTQADASQPVVRLESHLNLQSARDMAMDTRRLLSRASLDIANGNRKTLQDVVGRHTPREG